MSKGRIVAAKAVPQTARKPGEFLYVDKQGNVRGVKRAEGGKPGRKVCRKKSS